MLSSSSLCASGNYLPGRIMILSLTKNQLHFLSSSSVWVLSSPSLVCMWGWGGVGVSFLLFLLCIFSTKASRKHTSSVQPAGSCMAIYVPCDTASGEQREEHSIRLLWCLVFRGLRAAFVVAAVIRVWPRPSGVTELSTLAPQTHHF